MDTLRVRLALPGLCLISSRGPQNSSIGEALVTLLRLQMKQKLNEVSDSCTATQLVAVEMGFEHERPSNNNDTCSPPHPLTAYLCRVARTDSPCDAKRPAKGWGMRRSQGVSLAEWFHPLVVVMHSLWTVSPGKDTCTSLVNRFWGFIDIPQANSCLSKVRDT